jgi:hypothetical protein
MNSKKIEKINTNTKIPLEIIKAKSKGILYIYIYTNGSEKYQTIGQEGLIPKIIGTSYKNIIKIDITNLTMRELTNCELAEAQGYTGLDYSENFKVYMPRIIGNSIPKEFIKYEIDRLWNSPKDQKPRVGVIGAYGLEGMALENTNSIFVFSTITNHINNGYLSSGDIEATLTKYNKPDYIYQPNNYHNSKVDILLIKFPCKYGSNQTRNSNSRKQIQEKEDWETELIHNTKYINEYSPKYIITELPSNVNHQNRGSHNDKKIKYMETVFGKDYIGEYYAFNTKDYGLKQNRRSYMVVFRLELPKNIIRGYDELLEQNYYYNMDTKKFLFN